MAPQGGAPIVVVLGASQMDLIGIAPRLPAPGETLVGERFYTAPGGKGANQAVAAARLGAHVRMVGRVGNDVFGPMLLENLRSHGVDVDGVATDGAHASGVSVILMDAHRQNHIVAVYGANLECDGDQLLAAKSALADADSLLLQMEIPFDVSLAAAKAARQRGVRVIWDPAPATDIPPDAYPAMDIITPNQTEAAAITGTRVTDVATGLRAAEALLERGAAAAGGVVGAAVARGAAGAGVAGGVAARGCGPAVGVDGAPTGAATAVAVGAPGRSTSSAQPTNNINVLMARTVLSLRTRLNRNQPTSNALLPNVVTAVLRECD